MRKTYVNKLVTLIKDFGYWSKEVLEFNDVITKEKGYIYMADLNNRAKGVIREDTNLKNNKYLFLFPQKITYLSRRLENQNKINYENVFNKGNPKLNRPIP